MNNKTKELGLVLTGADEAEKTFQQFRLELSGNTGNSNMEIIDKAFGDLVTLIGNKKVHIRAVDGYVQYSEDDVLWENVIAVEDLRGDDYNLTDADKADIAARVVDLLPKYGGEVEEV